MADDFEDYARYFFPGMRVRVGIPLVTGKVFQEWGVVGGLEQDLLELRLSRDLLPEDARLEIGRAVELRVVHREKVRFCRGVVVSADPLKNFLIRLIEDVVIDEPREYYRHDVFLPVDYRRPFNQDEEAIRTEWLEKRREKEFAAQQPELGEPEEVTLLREALKSQFQFAPELPLRAANMSGGGLRFAIPECLEPQSLVELTIYLPMPRRLVEIVGEVVNRQPMRDGIHYSTALRFRYIDERDRDAVVHYISAEQLAHLARLRDRGTGDYQVGAFFGKREYWIRVAIGLGFIALCTGFLARSIVERHRRGEKHEIERAFEDGVKRYLQQRE